MKTKFLRSVVLVLALGFGSLVLAADLGAVKARMEQRLPQIDALKTQGTFGENNRGLLEVRGSGADAGSVAAAENKDREEVYAALAQKTGSSVAQVGKARAAMIVQQSAPGVWVQDESGNWKKK